MEVGQRDRVDLWLAFAAGPDHWVDDREDDPLLDDTPRIAFVAALVATASWVAVWTATGSAATGPREVVLLVALGFAVATWSWLTLGRVRQRRRTTLVNAVLERALLGATVAACAAGLTVDLALLGLWPLGAAAGADLTLTSNALGVPLAARRWTLTFLKSPAHLGVLVALIGAALVLQDRAATARLAILYATFLGCVAAAAGTVAVFGRWATSYRTRLGTVERRTIEHEHRLRGHWLHDDVCADLRSVRLQLETSDPSPLDIAHMLDELDHRLRVRQLDEFISTGQVRLAEVVQPYLRRVQQEGVVVTESPTLETAGTTVPAECGRLVQRAVAVLVANSVQAGSPWVALRLGLADDEVLVEVEDAAGGFDLDDVPLGRGLDRLRSDLGVANLSATRTTAGSITAARVPRRTP